MWEPGGPWGRGRGHSWVHPNLLHERIISIWPPRKNQHQIAPSQWGDLHPPGEAGILDLGSFNSAS